MISREEIEFIRDYEGGTKYEKWPNEGIKVILLSVKQWNKTVGDRVTIPETKSKVRDHIILKVDREGTDNHMLHVRFI